MSYQGVAIFAEWTGKALHPVSLELLSEARRLAEELNTKVLAFFISSPEGKEAAQELIKHGADEVVWASHEKFSSFLDDLFTRILVKMVEAERPEILLFPATARGQALAPRVAGFLRLGLTAHCIAFEIDPKERRLVQIRPSFGENIMAKIISLTKPQMATVRPGVFPRAKAEPARQGEIKPFPLEEEELKSAITVLARKERPRPKIDLSQAKIIVAGGRGLGSKEFFNKLFELADLLGAAVGATRPVCHLGWVSEEHMIGVSGQTVSPRLYLGFGISGAIHHLVGLRHPGLIVAVNTDPEAPLMKRAEIAVEGDVRQILPLLIQRIKALKGAENAS